ncbi:hypothetical protein BDM02DRAFT_3188673 [Thelephora ganbajun]|uniref:Uncharacterized protein n=1 Tax=Thelephora ganbajun TaxID=370292 RepID=A0ACB6ZBU0_THEGA|nr:hypothetical protein BDM02DRAFT_3188673 [Thelephora ganbajun]
MARIDPSKPEQDLPCVIAAMMFWSDKTVLNLFGQNKAWPVYFFFGNQPKSKRAKPTAGGECHLAYLPQLPDRIQDKIKDAIGKAASRALLTHCQREIFQAAWLILIQDPEFLDAYVNGMIIDCIDGVRRRVFPQFFMYLADYPEKTLIATIKDFGTRPCPRCLVTINQIQAIGREDDRKCREESRQQDDAERRKKVDDARKSLYDEGYAIAGDHVDGLLKDESLVPTKNAFSVTLSPFGFDFHKMLTVDLLHEVELGVWKALLAHLIRMLHACGVDKVHEFDERFQMVPTFGDKIRHFEGNISEMKRLAGRDLEDILQSIIPCIEGLFLKPHNTSVIELLFIFATWHALAKLHIHTDTSLRLLDTATTALGNALQYFARVTCPEFNTFETSAEYTKRQHQQAAATSSKSNTTSSMSNTALPSTSGAASSLTPNTVSSPTGRQCRTFSLKTIKLHFLGDYVSCIKMFRTTDNYNSALGENCHHQVKLNCQSRSNNKEMAQQLGEMDYINFQVHRVADNLQWAGISIPSNSTVYLPYWIRDHRNDPALTGFMDLIHAHLCDRLSTDVYTDERVFIKDNILYEHPLLTVDYTTYDLKRDKDLIHLNFRNQAVMVYSPTSQGTEPWLYAHIIAVYHLFACTAADPEPKRLELLWVRWMQWHPSQLRGLNASQYTHISFTPHLGIPGEAFGFVDPSHIIRGCHLIPTFDLQ